LALAVAAAIAPGETVLVARGPPPASAAAPSRRQLYLWGIQCEGVEPCLHGHQICAVALGDEHTLAVGAGGLCFSWGGNAFGQLGTGGERPSLRPRAVAALSAVRIVDAFAGPQCSGALDSEHELHTWGRMQPASTPERLHTSWINRKGATECGRDVQSACFGSTHALLLTRDGAVWSFGYNEAFQLGWPEALGSSVLRFGLQKPRRPLDLDGRAVGVAAGDSHSVILYDDGRLVAWGANSAGQCDGGGGADLVPLPMPVASLSGESVREVRCVGNSTLVVTTSGRAHVLGGGGRGAPTAERDEDGGGDSGSDDDDDGGGGGGGDDPPAATPQQQHLRRLLGAKRCVAEDVEAAACSADHALLVRAGGRRGVVGLGYNRYGQASGDASDGLRLAEATELRPSLLGLAAGGGRVVAVAAGGGSSAAITVFADSLAERCAETLRAVLNEQYEGEPREAAAAAARCCAALLLERRSVSALDALAPAVVECARRRWEEVARIVERAGEDPRALVRAMDANAAPAE